MNNAPLVGQVLRHKEVMKRLKVVYPPAFESASRGGVFWEVVNREALPKLSNLKVSNLIVSNPIVSNPIALPRMISKGEKEKQRKDLNKFIGQNVQGINKICLHKKGGGGRRPPPPFL